MTRAKAKPNSIDAYLAAVPATHRAALTRLRTEIKIFQAKATEHISYGKPLFKLDGHPLAGFQANKAHSGFFVWSSTALGTLKDVLDGYDTAQSTIRFAPGELLPKHIIKAVLLVRAKEIKGHWGKKAKGRNDVAWLTQVSPEDRPRISRTLKDRSKIHLEFLPRPPSSAPFINRPEMNTSTNAIALALTIVLAKATPGRRSTNASQNPTLASISTQFLDRKVVGEILNDRPPILLALSARFSGQQILPFRQNVTSDIDLFLGVEFGPLGHLFQDGTPLNFRKPSHILQPVTNGAASGESLVAVI